MYSLVELVECSQEEPREPNYAQSPNLPHTPSLSTLLHFNLFSSILLHISSQMASNYINRAKRKNEDEKNRNSLSVGKLRCSKKGDQHVVQGS